MELLHNIFNRFCRKGDKGQEPLEAEVDKRQRPIEAGDQKPPILRTLLDEIGKEKPNVGRLANALLDMSEALLKGYPNAKENIEILRKQWATLTQNGSNPDGAAYGEIERFQNQLEEIIKLREHPPGIGVTFYVPGGAGIVRVTFSINEKRGPKVQLDPYCSDPLVNENFKRLVEKMNTKNGRERENGAEKATILT